MAIADSNIYWARAEDPNGTGVLVLAGSSGRLDVGRAEMLASRGVTALALRWFGGDAQPLVPCEIPLETFIEAIDMLAGGATDRADGLVVRGRGRPADRLRRRPRRCRCWMAPTDVAGKGSTA